MTTAQEFTLIVWAMTFAYFSQGAVILLAASILRKELREQDRRNQPTLRELARMKRTLDYLETTRRVEQGDFSYPEEDE